MVGRLRDLAEQVYKMAAPKQKSSSWRRCSPQGGQHLPYQVAPCSSRSGAPWQGRLCTCSHSEDSEGRIQEAYRENGPPLIGLIELRTNDSGLPHLSLYHLTLIIL